ncbi:MAG: hypothetical protein ABW221_23660 [Vicinamibacteria bacterium]
MMVTSVSRGLAAALLSCAATAGADVWDLQEHNDDTVATRNSLRHGAEQLHDLAVRPGPVADVDWYLVYQNRDSSYEVVVDGISGDAGTPQLERLAPGGTTVIQAAGNGTLSMALRWMNTAALDVGDERVRVSGQGCGTDCGSDDVYSIRVRETTVYVPRFNNSGTQGTVLLLQAAPAHQAVNVRMVFRTADGTLLHTIAAQVPFEGSAVFSLPSYAQLAGQSGHVTIGHDGGYGGLVVKAVAIEPATGFTFDTPGASLPH